MALSALVTLVVLSAAQRPAALAYDAPEGCPSRDFFERALLYRTDRVTLVPPGAASARLRVTVTKRGKQYAGTLVMRTDDAGGNTKTLKGAKCETVVVALSVAAALLLDPEGAKLGPLPDVLPPLPPSAVPPVAEPVADSNAELSAAPAPEAALVLPEAPAVALPPTPTPTPTLVQPAPAAPRRWPEPRLALFAAGHLTTAVSASVDVGGGAAVDLDWPTLATRLTLGAGSGRTVAATSGEAQYFFHALAQLDVGARLRVDRVRPEVGAALQVLPLALRAVEPGAPTFTRVLVGVGPYARVGVEVEAWRFAAQAQLGFNLLREHYVIAPSGTVFSAPAAYLAAALQVGHTLP